MKVAFFAVQNTPGRLMWETPKDCQEGSDKRQHETTCKSVQYRDDFESYVQVRPTVWQTVWYKIIGLLWQVLWFFWYCSIMFYLFALGGFAGWPQLWCNVRNPAIDFAGQGSRLESSKTRSRYETLQHSNQKLCPQNSVCVCVPVLRVKVCTMDWCNRTVCCGSSRKKEFYATSWLRACFHSNEMISNIARTRWETWKQQEMREHRSRIECLQRDPEKTQQTARKK